MKILYLHTDVVSDGDVARTLGRMGCSLVWMQAPQNDEKKEDYAEKLLKSIEEQGTELVLSLKYFPVVSLACNVAAVKYATWIVTAYDPGIYSCTLLNSCNYVFMADYGLYEEFLDEGFPHLYYLPLGACTEWVDSVISGVVGRYVGDMTTNTAGEQEDKIEGKYLADLLLPCEIQSREKMGRHPLMPDSPLKDATKGYLEGCIACQHQMSGLPSMAEHLPSYVWEDLVAHFAVEVGADSVESASHYYDSRFFNPLITAADREIHLGAVAKNPYFKQVWQDNGWSRKELLRRALHSRISLVIANRNWRSAIVQVAWDIMASGGFIVGNYREDYIRLFPKNTPALYGEERELLSRTIYYLHHEQEREELARELSQEVRTRHTCRQRLEEMVGKIV